MNKNLIKKLVMIFSILISLFVINYQVQAETNTPLIVFSATSKNNQTIEVKVDLQSNKGIYAMNVELQYDKTAFKMLSYERGTALSSLDLITTGNSETSEKYYFNFCSLTENIDASNGNLLTIMFNMKDTALDGEYTFGFGYNRNSDVTTLANGEIQTLNLVVRKATIKKTNSDLVVIEESNSSGNNSNNLPIILTVSFLSLGCVVVVLVIVFMKRKRTKGWKKI